MKLLRFTQPTSQGHKRVRVGVVFSESDTLKSEEGFIAGLGDE